MEIDVKKVRNTSTDSHGRTHQGLFSHDEINLVFEAGKSELSPEPAWLASR